MINFILKGHEFENDIQTAIQIFFPNRHYYPAENIPEEGMAVLSVLTDKTAEAYLYTDKKIVAESIINYDKMADKKEIKHILKETVFKVFNEFTGYMPKWGMITGVRPAKTASELSAEGMSDEEILEYFKKRFYVSDKKALLALNVSKAEREILASNTDKDLSVYIGIPFCPTRCLYCSFTSYPIDRYAKKADLYIEYLAKELDFIK